MPKVELRIRDSTVYKEKGFSLDRETGKLLSKQLSQLGIDSDLFSGESIPIKGRKELSKEELRKRYIYPSSIKRITELEESLLIEEEIREFEEKVSKQILEFLTPSQRERLKELLKGKVI